VIRIRYPDFSSGVRDLAGLHGIAEPGARGVTVYLLPGLTASQRKAVIRRLRQEASRGFGPPLPMPSLVIALCADRMRVAAGTTVAVFRLHPTVMLLPGAAVAAMTLFMLASTGAAGPAPRTGIGGALAGNGYSASAARASTDRPIGIGLGGNGLDSAVHASGWQASPHGPRKAHRPGKAHRPRKPRGPHGTPSRSAVRVLRGAQDCSAKHAAAAARQADQLACRRAES
jgi:hypothetical protein